MMSLRTRLALLLLTTIVLADGCHRPTLDHSELAAIRSGAVRLMRMQATQPSHDEPASDDWPIAIQQLRPDRVIVRQQSVYIITTSWFDGGWGYYVTHDRSATALPNVCYRPIGKDVYWHDPC